MSFCVFLWLWSVAGAVGTRTGAMSRCILTVYTSYKQYPTVRTRERPPVRVPCAIYENRLTSANLGLDPALLVLRAPVSLCQRELPVVPDGSEGTSRDESADHCIHARSQESVRYRVHPIAHTLLGSRAPYSAHSLGISHGCMDPRRVSAIGSTCGVHAPPAVRHMAHGAAHLAMHLA